MTTMKIKKYSVISYCGFASLIALGLTGCDDNVGDNYQPPTPPIGVIFTYPMDGQSDVHLGTRFFATFSADVSSSAINQSCTYSNGTVTGSFCLLDSTNKVLSITPTINGKVVEFETTELKEGENYRLFVRPAVVGGGTTNLPETEPLLSFKTAQIDPVKGVAPSVLNINGEDPAVFSSVIPAASRPTPRYPLLDYATLRVSFSEPIEPASVEQGSSFQFVEVLDDVETEVQGALMVNGQHLIFDPDEDLNPEATYALRFSADITDKNGEHLTAVAYELTPLKADVCGCAATQKFKLTATKGDIDYPQNSRLTGSQLNRAELYSPLIGTNYLDILGTTFLAQLADTSAFGTLIPFVIRKGAFLDITGIPLMLGGKVNMNQETGDLKVSFISDVTGFISRNPYQDESYTPDDDLSPLFVYLNFDLSLSAKDATGNAILSQMIPNVQALGTAKIKDGQLFIETVRSLEVSALGLDRAPLHLVLGFNSDLNASIPSDNDTPRLAASYPVDGSEGFAVNDSMQLIFNEGMESSGVNAQDQITLVDLNSGSPVPFTLAWEGSTILLNPDAPLNFGDQYQISVGALQSVAKNALMFDAEDATEGDGTITFTAEAVDTSDSVPPVVTSIHKGIPCALTGTSYSNPGYCQPAGDGTDDPYNPIVIPANGHIEVEFNQPMNVSTLSLGTNCNAGAIRIERVNADTNACIEPVEGTLHPDTRGFTFTPNVPWVEGERYKLTLVGSLLGSNNDNICEDGEICGANDAPLNTNPLRGDQANDGGGPNIVNLFEVSAASDERLLPLTLDPITDTNGNGFVDTGETAHDDNSARLNILSTSGIVEEASIDGNDTLYLSGSLPVTIHPAEPISIDGNDWNMTLAGSDQTPIELHPSILYGSSIRLDTTANVVIKIPINNIDTGMTLMRIRQPSDGPLYGYIVEEEGVDSPQFVIKMNMYFDAPDMDISVAGVISVTHNLHSYPLSVTLKGPVTFMPDGRLKIDLENVSPVDINVEVVALGLKGGIDMQIGTGDMQVQLFADPLHGQKK